MITPEGQKPLLDSVPGFLEGTRIQRAYNWELILPDLSGAPVAGAVVGKYCQSVRLGQYDISEVLEVKSGFWKDFFPGAPNIENVTTSFVNPVPDAVSLYFQSWKGLIISERGFYTPSSRFKKSVHVMLYDRSGVNTNMITLQGAFPVKFPSFNLSYAEEKEVRFEIVLKIDRISMRHKAAGKLTEDVGPAAEGKVGGIVNVAESVF